MSHLVFNGAVVVVLVELSCGQMFRASVAAGADEARLRPDDGVSVSWDARMAHTFMAGAV